MSRKSTSSNLLDPARPFDPKVWKEAERMARRYQVLTWYDEAEKAWFGQCMEIPGCMSHGDTPAERDEMVAESIALCVADMMERGERPPVPLSECARTTQVNIRLTQKEKLIIEHAAKAHGYHGVSDYVRAKAMGA